MGCCCSQPRPESDENTIEIKCKYMIDPIHEERVYADAGFEIVINFYEDQLLFNTDNNNSCNKDTYINYAYDDEKRYVVHVKWESKYNDAFENCCTIKFKGSIGDDTDIRCGPITRQQAKQITKKIFGDEKTCRMIDKEEEFMAFAQ